MSCIIISSLVFRVRIINGLQPSTDSQVIAAFDPSIANHNGAYLEDGVVHNDQAPAYGLNEENADKLWELSEKMWGIKF